MSSAASLDKQSFLSQLFVPSLVLAYFSTWILEALTGVFLKDIAQAFFGSSDPVHIAVASQLVTISSGVSVVFGVLLGLLSVRFSHRKLLLMGVLCVVLGTLGCFFAPSFLLMQVFFPIEGIGTVMVGAMSFALVGEFLVLSKRPKASGWILAGGPLGGIAGSLVISFFFANAGAEGWRYFLLWFALPISLTALVAVYFVVPSSPNKSENVGKGAYLSSFREVFLQRSAASCLVGNMVRQAGLAWGVVYSVTFFREQFGLSLASGALIALVSNVSLVLASVLGGHLINRIGRKRQLVTTLIVSSLFLLLLAFAPNLWIALVLSFTGAFIYGMGFPGSVNLTLEQAPESRGTMMSMSTIFVTLGLGLGTAIGGAVLALFKNYSALIFTYAALSLTAAPIYFFLTKDPVA
jgi:MFS family permease